MRKTITLVVVSIALPALAIDWPQWRGPNRNGVNPEKNLLEKWPEGGPKLLWRANGIGGGFSSVATSEGVLYTLGDLKDACYLIALDLKAAPSSYHAQKGQAYTHAIIQPIGYLHRRWKFVPIEHVSDPKQVDEKCHDEGQAESGLAIGGPRLQRHAVGFHYTGHECDANDEPAFQAHPGQVSYPDYTIPILQRANSFYIRKFPSKKQMIDMVNITCVLVESRQKDRRPH